MSNDTQNRGITPDRDGLWVSLKHFRKTGPGRGERSFWDAKFAEIIMETMGEYLPHVEESPDGTRAKFHLTRDGREVCSQSEALGDRAIPEKERAGLDAALAALKARAEGVEHTTRQLIDAFTLPDPAQARGLYRLYSSGSLISPSQKLLLLWGCEPAHEEEGGGVAAPFPAGTAAGAGATAGALGAANLGSGTRGGAGTTSGTRSTSGAGSARAHRSAGRWIVPLLVVLLLGTSGGLFLKKCTGPDKNLADRPTPQDFNDPNRPVQPVPPPERVVWQPGQYLKVRLSSPEGTFPAVIAGEAQKAGTITFHDQAVKAEPGRQYTASFHRPGNYVISWKPDEAGPNDESKTIEVRGALLEPGGGPVAVLSVSPNPAKLGEPVVANVTASFDPQKRPLESYEIRWEETGAFEAVNPAAAAPIQHAYAKAGEYEVRLRVKAGGQAAEDAVKVSAFDPGSPNPAPTPNLLPVPSLLYTKLDRPARTATFADGGSYDPDGRIVRWTMDWGDGSEPETRGMPFETVSHAFAPGKERYEVTLECEDDRGAKERARASVDLTPSAPPLPVPPDPGPDTLVINRDLPGTVGELRLRHLTERREAGGRFTEAVRAENPIEAPRAVLSDYRWVVRHEGAEVYRSEGEPVAAFSALPGRYELEAEASDPAGKVYHGKTSLDVPAGTWKPDEPAPQPVPPDPGPVVPKDGLRLTIVRAGLEAVPDSQKAEVSYRVQGNIGSRRVALQDVAWTIISKSDPSIRETSKGELVTTKLPSGAYRVEVRASAEEKQAAIGATDTIKVKLEVGGELQQDKDAAEAR